MSDELTILRLQRESEDLERYETQLLVAAAHLKLYRRQFGHDPESQEALQIWAATAFDQPVDPYSVLTRIEIAQLWEDAEY